MKYLSKLLMTALLFPAVSLSAQEVNLHGQRSYATGADQSYGIWEFNSLADDNTISEVKNLNTDPNAGGALAGDNYYCFSVEPDDWGGTSYYMYIYDADDFTLITRAACSSYFMTEGQITAYNPADGKIYVAYQSGYYDFYLGALDVSNRSRTSVGTLSTQLVAMAFHSDGTLYGITSTGYLYKINTTNAGMSYIGSTGVSPDTYSQTACVSADGSAIYWAAYVDDNGALYKINTATGRASKIKDFPAGELFASLWIDSIIVADDAPAAATSLTASFEGGSLQGTVTFTLPAATHSGAPLTGAVGYAVSVDGVTAVSGSGSAGETVTHGISVTGNGKHDITVVCSNSSGQGDTAEIKGLFIGKDTPGYATDITLAQGEADGELILTWVNPTSGINGGYFNPDEVKYRIRRMPDDVIASDDATSPFSEIVLPATPQRVFYEVIPYIGDIVGLGMPSNKIMTGTPYTIPYNEDFSETSGILAYTIEDTNGDGNSWEWQYDFGYFRVYNNETAKDDWIFTPFIRLEPGYNYTLAYDIRSLAGETMSVWLSTAPESSAIITPLVENSTVNTDYEWETRTHDFTVETAGNYHICWHANTTDAANALALYLDNVAISGLATSAAAIASDTTRISLDGGVLALSSASPADALVASADGRAIYRGRTGGLTLHLDAGIYIVRYGSMTRKIIVK